MGESDNIDIGLRAPNVNPWLSLKSIKIINVDLQPAFCFSWAQALDDPSLLDSTDGVAVATVEPY